MQRGTREAQLLKYLVQQLAALAGGAEDDGAADLRGSRAACGSKHMVTQSDLHDGAAHLPPSTLLHQLQHPAS